MGEASDVQQVGTGREPGRTLGGRRQDIQGLRALAVLLVVLFHAGLPVPGGFVGVDVFFVVSGYVITSMLAREWGASGRIAFTQFYLRRFKRLTPALALMIAVTMPVSAFVLSPLGTQQVAAQTGLGAILLVANLVITRTTGGYFDSSAETNPLLNTWSLSVEEQFYLVFPALLAAGWLIGRAAGRRSLALNFVGLAGAVSLLFCMLGAFGVELPGVHPELLGFYSPIARAWEFAVGAMLALAPLRLPSRGSATVMGLTGLLMLTSAGWLIGAGTRFPGPWTLLPVIGTLLLIRAGQEQDNPVTRALGSKNLVRIGDWSYSIYLWHWPFIVFAGLLWPESHAALLVAALLSFAPALASYHWVEQPIRQMPTPSLPRLGALVVATLTPPVVMSIALWQGAQNGFGVPSIQQFQAAVRPHHADHLAGCDTMLAQDLRASEACTWAGKGDSGPIYLIGDSHASHLSEALIVAGEALGRPVTISTSNGCPFTGTYWRNSNARAQWNRQCNDYIQGTMRWLGSALPGTVVVSSLTSYWAEPNVSMGLTPDAMTSAVDEKARSLEAGLATAVEGFQAAGHAVLLVQDTPYVGWVPTLCKPIDIVREACVRTVSVEEATANKLVDRSIISSVSVGTGAEIIDLVPPLCPGGRCSSQRGGVPLYRDTNHLSVPASAELAPLFVDAIGAGTP